MRIEEVCFRAWPALREVEFDGWLLRFAEGHTRRINSVNPIRSGSRDLLEKIVECERFYRAEGLPTIFRLPNFLEPALDPLLNHLGYRAEDETSVRFMELAEPLRDIGLDVQLSPAPDVDWLRAYAGLSGFTDQQQALCRRIFAALVNPAVFAASVHKGRVASLAYGVLHDNVICINSVVTDPIARRKGFSRSVLRRILAWGRHHDATGACVQVMVHNEPALALYKGIGFTKELYRYHYRRQAADSGHR